MTDYLRLAKENAPAQPLDTGANPYLDLARSDAQAMQTRARTVLETALKDDPEIAAERQRLSKSSGVPLRVVERNLDELRVKEQARAVDLTRMAQESPILYRQLVDPTFTTVAQDDLPTLTKIERAVNNALRYATSGDDNRSLWGDLKRGSVDVALGATAGLGEGIFNVTGAVYDLLGWESGALDMRTRANASREARQSFGMQPESDTGKAVKSGLGSAGTNLALLPLGLQRGLFATAEQAGTAVSAIVGTMVGADAYLKAREEGKGQAGALLFGVPQGVYEWALEKVPASKLFGDLATNQTFLRTLGNQLVTEGATEQATTLLQDFNEWMNLNPEKSLGEFIAERPDAAYQTFIATLVGTGVQTTALQGVNKAVEQVSNKMLTYEQDQLNELLKLAGQSTLRQRSPEQFKAHIEQVLDSKDEGGAKKEVYVDAEVLAQLPAELLAQLPPDVQDQIPGALETGSTVAIPMADVLTVAPGTPLEQTLNDYARLRPDAPTKFEAQQTAKEANKLVLEQADRIAQQATQTEQVQAEVQTIRENIAGQLKTAGRFSNDVNDGYSRLVGAFYSTMAQRLGVTPSELYARFPLRVTGGETQGLAQGEQRDLIVTHNLTGANLLHAVKMGGIAVPSLAITKKDTPLTGFGEITLVGDSAMADPKGYAGTKVFGADIYSPRYPSVTFEFKAAQRKQGEAALRPAMEAVGQDYVEWSEVEKDGPRELERTAAFLWKFLTDKGLTPEVKRTEVKPLPPEMMPFAEGKLDRFDLTRDEAFIDAAWKMRREFLLARNEGNEAETDAELNEERARVKERGQFFFGNDLARQIENYRRDLRDSGKVDREATRRALQNQVREADLSDELEAAARQFIQGLAPNERIFQGFTPSGNRKYVPHTLENVVKILKKELRGGESFNYGVGSLRAKFTPEFKSLAAIKKEKGRLVSAEQFAPVKEEVDAELAAIATELGLSLDQTIEVFEDAPKMGVTRAIERALKDYGSDATVDEETTLRVGDFLTKLRNLPTAYFEAKILRDVSLSEFKAAVVPEGTDQAVLDALTAAGVQNIRTYKKGDEADRAAKIGENSDLFFQKGAQTATPQATLAPDEEGMPSIDAGAVYLGYAQPALRPEFIPTEESGEELLNLAITGPDRFETFGYVEATFKDGRPTAIYDIFIDPSARASGAATKAVQALLETSAGAKLHISNIVPSAQGFWEKLGVPAQNLEEGATYDGEITNESFLASPAGKKSSRAAGAAGPGQGTGSLAQSTLATYSPKELLIALGPESNYSSFIHELGHFWLDALADMASQPGAPQQVVDDFNTTMQWFGVDPAAWSTMTLDQKRAHHERWAESVEQYIFEGKAPSLELQPLFRRFVSWMKTVYGELKRFIASRSATPGGQAAGDVLAQSGDAFAKWFGDSKVVDAEGKPLVVYHGTGKDFSAFSKDGVEPLGFPDKQGFYFTPDADYASDYGSAVMPVYLAISNPYMAPRDGYEHTYISPTRRAELEALGHDGVIFEGNENQPPEIVAFRPEQIKSATGNDGTFDANDPSILSQGAEPQAGPLGLSDEIRRVMDRLIATDEQIAQAEEVAGMLPEFDATNTAIEKLQARSLANLKWLTGARDKYIKALQKEAREKRKDVTAEVTAEVDATPEMRAKRALDDLRKSTPEYKAALAEWTAARAAEFERAKDAITTQLLATEAPDAKGLQKGQFLAKNKRRISADAEVQALAWERDNPKPQKALPPDDAMALVADQTGYDSVDAMLTAIDQFGKRADAIEGMTDQRMLERYGDLIDARAIEEAANDAVHNEARARALAAELKAQNEAMNPRKDTGRTASNGRPITVNAMAEAMKQFANTLTERVLVGKIRSSIAQHRAAEARAGKAWQEFTAKGDTKEAVQSKRDQALNNYTVRAMLDAQAEAKKVLEFFSRVTQGNDEKTVERGRDPDVVNAMRAILAMYGVAPRLNAGALDYLQRVRDNDPAMFAALEPGVTAAVNNAKPLAELTIGELRDLHEELRAMWDLAKRSRQMEVDGNLLDLEEAEAELVERMTEKGIPDRIAGEGQAVTVAEERKMSLSFLRAALSRVEQWAERMDGKFGGPFLRLVFQPIKQAADRYRAQRADYRKRFTELVQGLNGMLPDGPIDAHELGYKFGAARDSGMAELLHAILHTGNESNKRKLLLGRGWARDNGDGTLDTTQWDAFIQRMVAEGKLQPAHFDFAQGVWDLLDELKPGAQQAHRTVYGRYFNEVTANEFIDPFGTQRRGGYVPAMGDPRLTTEQDIRRAAEEESDSMALAFPSSPRGFTKSRTEYNRPLLLDLRTLAQHIDKVILFTHMQPAVNDVRRLVTRKGVAYGLSRIDTAIYKGMLLPWLNRAAKQTVETPISGDGKVSRFASALRARAGMALMFGNLSNTLQQITGFTMAGVKVKPGLMASATAAYMADPKGLVRNVLEQSPYMVDRLQNETSAMTDAVNDLLINPSVYDKAQAWTQRHGYFLQTAFDKVMSPIIWTAAYNQAVEQGTEHDKAVQFADGVIRQTQGTTLPEDVSRFETGPAYMRLFTQFVGYFNMMANTNATAFKQIADSTGVKKGAGRALYVAAMGVFLPIWIAEAIAQAFRGGPDDEDKDGEYLDDWLMAVFGMGTARGLLAQVPILGMAAQGVLNRFNDNPADDKFSLSPAVSLVESAAGAPASVYKAIAEDGDQRKALRDLASAATLVTGLPFYAAARPLGYAAAVAQDKVEPTGPVDLARGLVTGTPSKQSKQ